MRFSIALPSAAEPRSSEGKNHTRTPRQRVGAVEAIVKLAVECQALR